MSSELVVFSRVVSSGFVGSGADVCAFLLDPLVERLEDQSQLVVTVHLALVLSNAREYLGIVESPLAQTGNELFSRQKGSQ